MSFKETDALLSSRGVYKEVEDDVASIDYETTQGDNLTVIVHQKKKPYPFYVSNAIYLAVLVYLFILFVPVFLIQKNSLPNALPADAPADQFSEARAFSYLQDLVNIALQNKGVIDADSNVGIAGRLSMTTSGNQTVLYLMEQLTNLQAQYGGSKLEVLLTTGSGIFANPDQSSVVVSFSDVTNVAARIPGSSGEASPAVLISAHHDTVAFSGGASDNGAAVAACLEILRTVLVRTQSSALPATLIVLFDDAEETGLLGAESFVTNHPWSPTVRVAINMDSNGGWGRALLTQVGPQSEWLAKVYAASVPFPEATVTVADLFSFLPSGTNYEVFSAANISSYDIDLYRNDYTYHTGLDVLTDYQNGTLQAMGQNTLDLLLGVMTAPEFFTAEVITENKVTATYYDILLGPVLAYGQKLTYGLGILCIFFTIILLIFGSLYWSSQSNLPGTDRFINVAISLLFTFCLIILTMGLGLAVPTLIGVLLELINPEIWFARLPLAVFSMAMWTFPTVGLMLWLTATIINSLNRRLINFNYRGPVSVDEVLTLVSVHLIHFMLVLFLTILRIGTAYLLFWWCICFYIASFFALIYLITRRKNKHKHAGHDLTDFLNHQYSKSTGSTIEDKKSSVSLMDMLALALFYLLWTTFPSLLIMDAAYRFILGITPQLGRLGLDNDSLLLGAGVGLFQGLIAIALLTPWMSLLQRFERRATWSSLYFVGAFTAFLVAAFAFAPYSDVRPRRVDVIHYHEFTQGDSSSAINQIMLGAPNPGPLSQVTDAMKNFNSWSSCPVVGYEYTYHSGLCLNGTLVPAPIVTMPNIVVQNSVVNGNTWTITIEISTPDAYVTALKMFNGTLTGWSVNSSVPVKGVSSQIDVEDGYAIILRTRQPLNVFTFSFDAILSPVVSFELWTSFAKLSSLQNSVILDLPSWTQVWGKSNLPGPTLVKMNGQWQQP